ncbi:hypothetical protein R1sor_012050 [Riccia sorocarpa]|uniref:Uncharacterized protein n=1 Tax=Riccia sorocarpa TaxID=122646 RepID=A0ABD3I4I6_9MARC
MTGKNKDIGNLVEISRTSIDRRESRSPVQKRGRPMTSDLNLLAEQIARNSEEHQRLQRLWQEKQVATQILKPATVVNGLMETTARGGDKGTSLFQPPKPPEIGSSSQAKNNSSVQASKITTGWASRLHPVTAPTGGVTMTPPGGGNTTGVSLQSSGLGKAGFTTGEQMEARRGNPVPPWQNHNNGNFGRTPAEQRRRARDIQRQAKERREHAWMNANNSIDCIKKNIERFNKKERRPEDLYPETQLEQDKPSMRSDVIKCLEHCEHRIQS